MAHDPLLEERIANALSAEGAKAEHKKMFGGVAFMVRGHMTVGITHKGDFMVRFDAARHAEISQWPGAKPMTFGKGNMKGFLFVDAAAVGAKTALHKWVRLSLAYNTTMPTKATGKSAPKAGKATASAAKRKSLAKTRAVRKRK